MKLATMQAEHNARSTELRRRVRDRNSAMHNWRVMFQAGEVSVKKFRSGNEKFRAAAMEDRRLAEAAGMKLHIATPDQP
jgi:hypothetical protein